MPTHYRSLLVVALLGFVGLLICRPVFAALMLSDDDFRRRRNLWFVITVAAFVLPSFWAYAAVAAIAVRYVAKRDSNPVALFPLLLVLVPPLEVEIPSLIKLHHPRLLILVLLAPLAWRLVKDAQSPKPLQLWTDKFLVAYCLLQVVLLWPYTSMTNSLRQIVMILIDIWIPYYVMSRAFRSVDQLRDALACFVLTMLIAAVLALAEIRMGTVLYSEISSNWHVTEILSYLTRGDALRAQLASGHAIVLGYQFAVAIGFWLYLQQNITSKTWRVLGTMALTAGLIAPVSRGPWVGTFAILAVFALIAPGAGRRTVVWSGTALLAFVAGLVTPWVDKMLNYLPFIGDAAQETVDYRQEILAVCWQIIKQNPFFGSPLGNAQLESLRTGEGIVDIVNTYVAFGMSYGMVGVALFVGIFISAMIPMMRTIRSPRTMEVDKYMGTSLIATLVGILITISTVSNYLTIPFIYFMVIGMTVSCTAVLRRKSSVAGVSKTRSNYSTPVMSAVS